ncbi:MAG: FKBP-type peptidyl-prolyl cis-trans isomerase [Candidatus Heimdallarchaeota archaeon]|nr:FKBP-type peptidyl-prolyl cis-trans isomerase [Candidatus Heimdallarchaeota archaeon]
MRKITLIVFLFIMIPIVSAYDSGIENGDKVEMEVEGRIEGGDRHGEMFQPHITFTVEVLRSQLIEGFYENVIGMQVNGEYTFIVQPEKAYTDISHELYNEALKFSVLILRIVLDISPDDIAVTDIDDELSSSLKLFLAVSGVILLFIIYPSLKLVLTKQLIRVTKKRAEKGKSINTFPFNRFGICIHCGDLSTGICSGCGANYCRKSFIKGCLICPSKEMKPN